jgi:hypothetical protein
MEPERWDHATLAHRASTAMAHSEALCTRSRTLLDQAGQLRRLRRHPDEPSDDAERSGSTE